MLLLSIHILNKYIKFRPILSLLAHLGERLSVSLSDGTPAGVCASICASTLLNMNISETRRPIIIKFHLDHHWVRGLSVLSSGSDPIRTLVSMATDSSHRVIMEKILYHSSFFILDMFFFILSSNEDNHKRSNGFKIRQDRVRD